MQRIKESTTKAVTSDDIDLTRKRLHLLMFVPERNVSEELVAIRHAIYHAPDFVRNIANLLSLQERAVRQRNLLHPEDLPKFRNPPLIAWGTNNPFAGLARRAPHTPEHPPLMAP